MKISYVGNRTNLGSDGKSFNTENHIALSLEKLGHEVNFIQENTIEPFTLVDRVKDSDMFLFTRTWDGFVTERDLREIEAKGVPTVSFHLDAYALIERDGKMGVRSPFWNTQYIFSPENSLQARRVFEKYHINQYYLPPGVYEDECYIAEPVDKFKHDIVFVGGGVAYGHKEWPYRGQLVTWLEQTYGNQYKHWGWPDETIRGKELNQLCSSAKIVIGDSLNVNFTDSHYFSDRIFETTGRGGFTIAPYIPGITDFFVDRKEAVFYGYANWVQLKNLIDYYLAEENAEEREAIRRAGHERTKRDHTYTNRMKTMIDILVQEGALKDERPY